MPATVVVGLQWGDEGKGKATDLLAESVSAVVRYQGGDNAGHTIVLGDEVFKLHLVPSGVLHPHITPMIGNGVVVNPDTLLHEMSMLAARGVDVGRIRVSLAAHAIMPYHVALDRAREQGDGAAAIGTTQRGIGPAYADRSARDGIRLGDLLDPQTLRTKLERVVPERNSRLAFRGAPETFSVDELVEQAAAWGAALRPHLVDTAVLLQRALENGERVLLEGAQGTLLDLDHGTYPFVTSSNPVAGGACTGSGVGPLQIDQVIGVVKAYSTRVGAGPFPTELTDEVGRHLSELGQELGTTTGRPRRCGWFDAVPLRYVVNVNSATSIVLNKLDILSGLPEVRICTGYKLDGRVTTEWPLSVAELERAEPVYETFPGWDRSLRDVRHMDDLPETARSFLSVIEELAGVPIAIVSVGPERNQTIIRHGAADAASLSGNASAHERGGDLSRLPGSRSVEVPGRPAAAR